MITIQNYKKLEGMHIIGHYDIGGVYEITNHYQIWLMDAHLHSSSTEIKLNRNPLAVDRDLYSMWTMWNGDRCEVYISKDSLKDPIIVCGYIKTLLDKR